MQAALSIYVGLASLAAAIVLWFLPQHGRYVVYPWFASPAAIALGGMMIWWIGKLPEKERNEEPMPLIRRQAWIGVVLGCLAQAASWAVIHRNMTTAADEPPALRSVPATVRPAE
jgi:hypothetical protein